MALFTTGRLRYTEGRYQEAVAAYEQAYALSGRADILPALADAYERVGSPERAREVLLRYWALDPSDETIAARIALLEPAAMAGGSSDAPLPSVLLARPAATTPVHRSPAPWLVAGVGGAAMVVGGAVAGSERELGFGTALAGGALSVGGITWGLQQSGAERTADGDWDRSTR